MQEKLLSRLKDQVKQLKLDAAKFDKAKHFSKNKFMQGKHSLFDVGVFRSKSMFLLDYVEEIEEKLNQLPTASKRHSFNFAIEKIAEQIEAIIKVLKATPVWQKENNAPQKRYKKVVEQVVQSSHQLYQQLAQNHEFERRLLVMIDERNQLLHQADLVQQQQLNKEILALHARLGRCRKAISSIEDNIAKSEQGR